jgi:hypothetical protein
MGNICFCYSLDSSFHIARLEIPAASFATIVSDPAENKFFSIFALYVYAVLNISSNLLYGSPHLNLAIKVLLSKRFMT